MNRITIRRTSAELPVFDKEAELEPVSSLGTDGGFMSEFQFGDASLPALDVRNVRLVRGKVRALHADQANLNAVHLDSVEFAGCDLSSVRWAAGKISRARFDTCKLLGARFEGVTLEHVVFTGCNLDYATFDHVRATGPVLFVHCSLRDVEFTGCDLAGSLFDDCDLHLANFGRGNYRGCDLRGNDLSVLAGTHHLKHTIIDRAQIIQLAGALAAELGVTFGDDLPDQPATD